MAAHILTGADYVLRALADDLFTGKITGPKVIDFVLSDHAHFPMSDCSERALTGAVLAAVLMSEQRFGWPSVHVIRSGA